MAKKNIKKKEEKPEVVANCDNPKEVDANCDHLENGELTLSQHDIEKLIITVRGEQVLIDQDIARLYGSWRVCYHQNGGISRSYFAAIKVKNYRRVYIG